jgi:hypothetical protein
MVLLKTFSMAPNLTTHFREGHQQEPSADASSCSFLHMATSRVQAGIQRQRRCSLHMATCADCADGSRTARAWFRWGEWEEISPLGEHGALGIQPSNCFGIVSGLPWPVNGLLLPAQQPPAAALTHTNKTPLSNLSHLLKKTHSGQVWAVSTTRLCVYVHRLIWKELSFWYPTTFINQLV